MVLWFGNRGCAALIHPTILRFFGSAMVDANRIHVIAKQVGWISVAHPRFSKKTPKRIHILAKTRQ
jgi:hypothetical protein